MTALVEPPMAALARMALANAARVSTFDMRRSSRTISTMRRPERWASRMRRASTAGIAAFSGSDMPSASTMLAIVDAVPIVMQLPRERCMQASASVKSALLSVPARTISDISITPVPEPTGLPRQLPDSDGPPDTPIVGRSTLAAPINSDGVVLSHPMRSTTPSTGLARMIPRHPCWRDCGTASRWVASASRRVTSPGIQAAGLPLRRHRA